MSKTIADSTMAEMLRGYSVELSPADPRIIDTAIHRLEGRTLVSLTWIPGSNPMHMIGPAARLRRAGFLVMPHIGARHIQSEAQLRQIAERLAAESQVDRILLVGGDRAQPAGPFDSSLAVMQTGAFQNVGITRMSVAGFPEGNPHISGQVLDDAIAAKVKFARSNGLQLSIVTQFCFAAEPIVAWVRRLRAKGIDAPVRIGLAGPARIMTLAGYAIRCGVGNSLRVLTENPAFAKALVDRGPEPIIREIGQALADRDRVQLGVAGLHFYTFGGLTKTLDWIDAARSRKPASACS